MKQQKAKRGPRRIIMRSHCNYWINLSTPNSPRFFIRKQAYDQLKKHKKRLDKTYASTPIRVFPNIPDPYAQD